MYRRTLQFIFIASIIVPAFLFSCDNLNNSSGSEAETNSITTAQAASGKAGETVVVNGQEVIVPDTFNEAAGEYFLAMMLHTDFDGSRFRATSRFTEDPVFWFKNGYGSQGLQETKVKLAEAMKTLTGGALEARFYESSTPPGNTDTVITVDFTFTNQGTAIPQSNWNNGGGVRLTGGYIRLSDSFLQGYPQGWNYTKTVAHELGHVMLGDGGHSAVHEALMTQGRRARDMIELEKAAWVLFHRLPVGTSLNDLRQSGIITDAMMVTQPRIINTHIKHMWPKGDNFKAFIGDTIYIKIERARYPFGCGSALSYPEPEVIFNGAKSNFVKEPLGLAQSDCNYAEAIVPLDATSGPMRITSYGQTGPSKYFTVLSDRPDFTGVWNTSKGKIKLHKIGNYVIGDYSDKGVMVGKLDGNCLKGKFTEGNTNGEFSMGINSASGEEFAGLWMRDKMNGPEQWRGTLTSDDVSEFENFSKSGSSLDIIKNKRKVYDGVYGSNRGEVRFFHRDLLLIGDFENDGILAGMWDGNSFQGLFTQGNSTGWFDLAFYSKTGSFRSGTWGWLGEENEAREWDMDLEIKGNPWPGNMSNGLRCR